MITCGRFDPLIAFDPDLIAKSTAVRRIVAPNPNCLQPFQFTAIATDGRHVLHESGLEELDAFLASHVASGKPPLVVLTNREYLAALEAASLRGCRLYAFESRFPLFPQLRHAPSLQANLATLLKLLRKVRQLGIVASSFSRDQSTRHLHSIARALKFKSGLDRFFFFSLREGQQEVYKHVEERPDRAVVALDFNSMFADCLRGSFCEPRAIRHRTFDLPPAALGALDEGIYRVVLRGARPGFVQDHHPFLFRRLGRSFHFRLDVGGSVETLLHKSELLHFERFFDAVDVKEGFCSRRAIAHPLAKAAERLYARRRHARSRGDDALEQFCKSSLQLMHSATNQRHDRRTGFASPRELRDFLASNYSLSLDAQVPPADLQRFLGRSAYFGVRDDADGLELRHLDIDAAGAVYLPFERRARECAREAARGDRTLRRLRLGGGLLCQHRFGTPLDSERPARRVPAALRRPHRELARADEGGGHRRARLLVRRGPLLAAEGRARSAVSQQGLQSRPLAGHVRHSPPGVCAPRGRGL